MAEVLLQQIPELIAIILLLGCSAFFSGSETALFSLTHEDLRKIGLTPSRSSRSIQALLHDPQTLLATVLFAAQLEIYRRVQFLLNHAHENYRQTEALFSLFSLLKIRRPLPPLRDFAISPDFANLLVALIDETRPRVILELGSGASTLITGYRLQQLGQGRIISLEHDEKYAAVTRTRLA